MNSNKDQIKVLVLCGGKGTRLRPITEEIPKPLVHIRGKPLVRHILEFYQKQGYNNFVLCIGYKGKMIREYFTDTDTKANITYVDSGDANMAQRIKGAEAHLGSQSIVSYGDTLANIDIDSLMKFHDSTCGLVTITTYKMKSPFGLVFSDEKNKISSFEEKPLLDYWMNIGFIVIEKEALSYISPEDDLVSFLKKLIKEGKVYEYKHTGKHLTVNTEKEKAKMENDIDKFYTYDGGTE